MFRRCKIRLEFEEVSCVVEYLIQNMFIGPIAMQIGFQWNLWNLWDLSI